MDSSFLSCKSSSKPVEKSFKRRLVKFLFLSFVSIFMGSPMYSFNLLQKLLQCVIRAILCQIQYDRTNPAQLTFLRECFSYMDSCPYPYHSTSLVRCNKQDDKKIHPWTVLNNCPWVRQYHLYLYRADNHITKSPTGKAITTWLSQT